ncbi:hypothetical protein BJF96_g10150 [Verticillium dahliae]|uniref:Uncharacterized protein n=1 Tax=Verticillium dahliae TaxID=27337 RepID=A0AA44W7Z8_VERDA|nr:hypothetical protein BJF96_g10150 [Verticillium dahliae]
MGPDLRGADSLQWLSERAGRQMRELQQDEPGVHLPTCVL